MIIEDVVTTPVATPLGTDATALAVIGTIEAGEAPMSDVPIPDEITDLTLLLLALAALLAPTRDDEAPIEDKARGYMQDLHLVWSF